MAWVELPRLSNYAMPGADLPVVAALLQPSVVVVADRADCAPGTLVMQLEEALLRGARRVWLRMAQLDPSHRRLCADAGAAAARHGAQLLLEGAPSALETLIEWARQHRAGVMLDGQLLASLSHRPEPVDLACAAVCRSLAHLQHAQRLGLDFVVLEMATAKSSATRNARLAADFARVVEWREQVVLPVYLAGDALAMADLNTLRAHGAQGAAVSLRAWLARG